MRMSAAVVVIIAVFIVINSVAGNPVVAALHKNSMTGLQAVTNDGFKEGGSPPDNV